MKRATSDALVRISLQVVGWVLAFLLFALVRFFGLGTVEEFRSLELSTLQHRELLIRAVVVGVVVGVVLGLLDLWLSRTRLRRMPYGRLILVQSAIHVALFILVLAGVRAWGVAIQGEGFDARELLSRVFSTNLLVILLYTGLVSVLFSFIEQVSRKFGPGNLQKMLRGSYYRPREEQRIFMFLDLQSSTTHAERLGHVLYSRLIQDCFRDLGVVLQNRAEVYQYVGDEAVLCWEMERGREDGNCLEAFFRFEEEIWSRADHYRELYGFVPTFKAGLNSGLVTVAEVGEIKREIAFHGDVLNTAARIQSKCNELERKLLISAYLKDELGETPAFRFEPMGTVSLRGRAQSVAIYAVEKRGQAILRRGGLGVGSALA